MSETDSQDERIALALPAAEALALLAAPDGPTTALIDRVDAVIVGAPGDLADPLRPGADATVLVSALARLFPSARFLATASFARDFPYNLARRIGSLSALAGPRIGVALVATDTALPTTRDAVPEELRADGAEALEELWQSWPRTSIVGDRARKLFVDTREIRLVAHDDLWQVRGPLQVPVDATALPPIVLWDDDTAAHGGLVRIAPAASDETGAGRFPRIRRTDASLDELAAHGWTRAEGELRAILAAPAPAHALADHSPAFDGGIAIQ